MIKREHLEILMESKLLITGLAILVSLILIAIFAGYIAPYDPIAQDFRPKQPPSSEHLLGTDELGRDVFSRLIYGSRITLYVSFLSIGVATLFGLPMGLIAGYYGGAVDKAISFIIDILLSFPAIILTILITAMLGPNLTNAMLSISVAFTPRIARIVRGQVLSVKEEDYVVASKAMGGKGWYIMLRHILPNSIAPLLVQVTLALGSAVIIESSLAFLGLSAQPPTPSWGDMINRGRRYIYTAPWMLTAPGIMITIAVLGFNLLGDGLRDVLDPRLRRV
jgi:peptide/nickel transport system permease protein